MEHTLRSKPETKPNHRGNRISRIARGIAKGGLAVSIAGSGVAVSLIGEGVAAAQPQGRVVFPHHNTTPSTIGAKNPAGSQGSVKHKPKTEAPTATNSKNGVITNLCKVIPQSVIMNALNVGATAGVNNTEKVTCSLNKAGDGTNGILFDSNDISHAWWGGATSPTDGNRNTVTVTVIPRTRYGIDRWKFFGETDDPIAIKIPGYPGDQAIYGGQSENILVGSNILTVEVFNNNNQSLIEDPEALETSVAQAILSDGFTKS